MYDNFMIYFLSIIKNRNLGDCMQKYTDEIVMLNHPKTSYAELYRTIRTNVDYAGIAKEIKVLALTSTIPGEAKTTNSIELAVTMASKHEKVLLIDCDLRKSRIHKVFNLRNNSGFTDFLLDASYTGDYTGSKDFVKTIQSDNIKNQLDVMVAGTRVVNPFEFLESEAFDKALAALKEQYDFIVLDCPPIGLVSDPLVIGKKADAMIYVIMHKGAKRDQIKHSIEKLRKADINVIGTILTKVKVSKFNKDLYNYGYMYEYYSDEKE